MTQWVSVSNGTIGSYYTVYVADAGDDTEICHVIAPTKEIGKQRADLLSAAPDLLEACKVMKEFLDQLESLTAADDPLSTIRKRVHAPLRAFLEPAINKAEGRA